MEKNIWDCIQRIKLYRDKNDIRFVRTEIGKYRINALNHYGYVRLLINRQANEIENELNHALENLV